MKPRPKPGCIVTSHPPRDPTIARSRWPAQSDARIVLRCPCSRPPQSGFARSWESMIQVAVGDRVLNYVDDFVCVVSI